MAPDASGSCVAELTTHMASGARQGHMCTGKREFGQPVVELGVLPIDRGVALTAIGGQARGAVVGICRRVELVDMAPIASRGRAGETPADVAGITGNSYVSAGERKLRNVVVELGVVPIDCPMAHRTVLRETGGRVRRIIGCIEILYVAAEAIRRSPLEASANVARRAIQARMRASQDESGLAVIECDPQPSVHVVARLARHGETSRPMVNRFSSIEIVNVTGGALCG